MRISIRGGRPHNGKVGEAGTWNSTSLTERFDRVPQALWELDRPHTRERLLDLPSNLENSVKQLLWILQAQLIHRPLNTIQVKFCKKVYLDG